MPMFNLLYSCKNFRKTTGSFSNYYPDKPSSGYVYDADNITAAHIPRDRVLKKIYNSESFDYYTKLINPLPVVADDANNDASRESEEIKIVITLKD